MARYRILVAYDGTDFSGWQRQADRRSVQQTIEEALLPLSPGGAPVDVNGSGRTDAGVHARGQVAHFDLAREIAGPSLRRALNDRLPEDVRVLRAEPAPPDFDARRSAHGKEYRYRVWNAEVADPVLRRYRLRVSRALDLAAMRRAAAAFVGEHDFAAFTANPQRPVESTVRRVFSVESSPSAPARKSRKPSPKSSPRACAPRASRARPRTGLSSGASGTATPASSLPPTATSSRFSAGLRRLPVEPSRPRRIRTATFCRGSGATDPANARGTRIATRKENVARAFDAPRAKC